MSWYDGVVIRGGYLQGSFLGVSDNIGIESAALAYIVANNNVNRSEGETIRDVQEIWYNTDFEKMIDVSSYFSFTHADFSDECIADIALLDSDRNLTGYFSIYLSRSGSNPVNMTITGKIKNASGVVQGSFNSNASIAVQTGVSGGVEPKCYLCLAKTIYNNNTIFGMYFNFNQWWYGNGHYWGTKAIAGAFIDNDTIYSTWGISGNIDTDTKKKSPEFGDASEPEGGYNEVGGYPHGTFDFSSDEIPIDSLPTLGVTSAGFINVYKIAPNDLTSLGDVLFPHFNVPEFLTDPSSISVSEMMAVMLKSFFGSTIYPAGYTAKLADNLGIVDILMNGKLIDYVLDCHVIPVDITASTTAPLKIGYRTLNDYQLEKATQDYIEINCGTLSIAECFGNFLDYGNCKVEIYLPFVGFVPIPNEYWNNAQLKVVYQFNIIDGSFQCKLLVVKRNDEKMYLKNSVIGQYGGVCCVHFPITGLQYSNVVSGLVNGSIGVATHAGAGDVGGVATNLMKMAMLRPDNPMSNGYNASSSFLAQRTPYLVIKRPAPQFSEHYPKEIGLPLNVYYPLSSIQGFTVIENPVLNIKCSDDEYNEIVAQLKNGVIF